MARPTKGRRGVSTGTIVILSLFAATFAMGGYIYSRLSGDSGPLLGDPRLLAEPLAVIVRSVTDVEPQIQASLPPQQTPRQAAETPIPAPTPETNRSFSLVAAGQVSVGQELRVAARDAASGAISFQPMMAPVKQALTANLSVATLRTTLTEESSQYERFRAPAQLAEGLKENGVNLFNLATDRLLDYGTGGVLATRNILRGISASNAGAYTTNDERAQYSIANFGGLRIGLLSYTTTISNNGRQVASDTDIGTATRLLSAQGAAQDIRTLREKGAEVVIVLAHWGNRSDTKPSKETRDFADALVEAGADIILGTNPTTVHELERRTVSSGGKERDVFIAYSLGNFLDDDSRDTPNITGMILHVDLEWDTQQQRLLIRDAWYMPTWIMRWKDLTGVNRYRVVPAGVSSIPEGMTDGVYVNMKKAYQSMITRIGSNEATPRAE
ncbi:MAG: CapA family protein [Clostridia bacterium]|nr:CapA family protein [Clostridia bacterium]